MTSKSIKTSWNNMQPEVMVSNKKARLIARPLMSVN